MQSKRRDEKGERNDKKSEPSMKSVDEHGEIKIEMGTERQRCV